MARELSGVTITGELMSLTNDNWPARNGKAAGHRVTAYIRTSPSTPPVECGLRPDLNPGDDLLAAELRNAKIGDRVAVTGTVRSYKDDLSLQVTDIRLLSAAAKTSA